MTRTVTLRGASPERVSFLTRAWVRLFRACSAVLNFIDNAVLFAGLGLDEEATADSVCRRESSGGKVVNRRLCLEGGRRFDSCGRGRRRRKVPPRCPRSRRDRRRDAGGGALS